MPRASCLCASRIARLGAGAYWIETPLHGQGPRAAQIARAAPAESVTHSHPLRDEIAPEAPAAALDMDAAHLAIQATRISFWVSRCLHLPVKTAAQGNARACKSAG